MALARCGKQGKWKINIGITSEEILVPHLRSLVTAVKAKHASQAQY
jgi:hypothetical protein